MIKTSFPATLARLTQKRLLHLHLKVWCFSLMLMGTVMLTLVSCSSYPTAVLTPSATTTISSSPTVIAAPSQIPILPTKPRPPADWELRWLRGIPCKPPCWEGITPGQTTASEAVALLKHSSIVLTAGLTNSIMANGKGVISWSWLNGEGSGRASYYMLPITTDETIYLISLFYPTEFTLRDIIQVYGDPSDVLARAYRNPDGSIASDVNIIYRLRGIGLATETMGKINLNLDTLVRVAFFAPTDEGLMIAIGPNDPNWLVPWQGVKDFEYYCKDIQNGKLCRGEP